MIFACIIPIEFCSALWNYVRYVVSSNYIRQVGWTLVRRNSQAVIGRVHFPILSIIILIITSVWVLFRSNIGDADESTNFELGRHASDIIGLIE